MHQRAAVSYVQGTPGAPGFIRKAVSWAQAQIARWGIFVVLLVLGRVMAKFMLGHEPYYPIAIVIALIIGVAVAYKPEFGILMYLVVAPLRTGQSPRVESQNSDYSAGLMPSEIALGFLLMIWLGRMFFSGRVSLTPSPLNKPLLALGAVCLASLACSQVFYDPTVPSAHRLFITQLAETGLYLLAIGAFFLTANSLKDERWIKAIIYPVGMIGAYVLFFKLSGITMPVGTPKSVLVTTIITSYVMAKLLFSQPRTIVRLWLGLLFVGCMVLVFQLSLNWISGLITTSVAILTVVYLRSRKAFLALVLVCLLLIAVNYQDMYDTSLAEGDMDRFGIWSDAARMALHTNPVLGIGPGNYYAYSFKYGSIWYGPNTYTTAHNNYAQTIAEMGLMGLIVLIWVVVAGVQTGLAAFKNARSDLKWIPAAATALFLAFAVASVLGDYLFPNRANGGLVNFGVSVFVWLTLGAAVAAGQIPSKSPDVPVREATIVE